ncbi:metalloregulator ArsR/SmtB family transcription factor [Cellulomonas sp. P24]|uniref:helix-turn-helix transcriptional regulator n=1 Tax=Cellulomonas sp. P24 TaxID=2885206 RepID=UPI00216AD723|nr:helix-turn-helix domain-containing protein [Cellulomonas sp. P24]MCR6491066.1 helix-turn-helix domain-containing protein [Cellulomonas sp. P24]
MPREPIDAQTHRVLSGVSRVAVLEALRTSAEPLDVQAIADAVGLHPNTVRSHLDQLVDAGLAVRAAQLRTTPGRPRLLFRAVPPSTDVESEGAYRMLARVLASSIDGQTRRTDDAAPGSVAAEAGRRWGHQSVEVDVDSTARSEADQDSGDHLDAVGRIVALLDEVGFAPRLREPSTATAESQDPAPGSVTATVIELHECPFRDVAVDHSDVVCGVHLGLIQGALDQMLTTPVSVRLEPFVSPRLCLAYLAPTATDGGDRPDRTAGVA